MRSKFSIFIVGLALFCVDLINCGMITEGHIDRYDMPKRNEKSLCDFSRLKLKRIRGGNILTGTMENLVDYDDKIEVFSMLLDIAFN
jgi:hypothetical protein